MSDDFFGTESVRSASFDGAPPITWEGEILAVGPSQQSTSYNREDPGKPGEPKWWKRDGGGVVLSDDEPYPGARPVLNLPVIIQTKAQDGPDDDGRRSIWYEQATRKTKSMLTSVTEASGRKAPGVGGYLRCTFTRRIPGSFNDSAKDWSHDYRVPEERPEDPWDGGTSQAATPAAPSPVEEFLRGKGLNPTGDPNTDLMIAKSQGYQG